MSTFTLAISCLTSFNLPWFMDLTFQIPMQYCSLQLDLASVSSHIHNWVFLLWLHPFILSGVISPWFLVAYWAPNDLGSSSFSILSFCLFILFMGFSRQEYSSGLPFPSPVDHILPNFFIMTYPSLVAAQAWLSFIELDKAVVLVWLDWLIFCDYGFSVSALWCPLATPSVLLGFLLPWTWGISSRLLQQSIASAPYLGRGVSPYHSPSWPWMWNNSSRPSCAFAATAPWAWGCSSWPLALALGAAWLLPATTPLKKNILRNYRRTKCFPNLFMSPPLCWNQTNRDITRK